MSALVAPRAREWERFEAKAAASGAIVHLVPDEEGAAALLPGTAVATATVARRFPAVAARCGGVATGGAPALDVVAAAVFGVAETGSVAVAEASAEDRGACFLSERLWLLLPGAELEASLDAALDRLAALLRDGLPYVTLMTGPSRTADIERTLTIGVHGPRAVTLVVVGDAPGKAAGG